MQNLQKTLPRYSIALAVVLALTVAYLLTRGNTVDVEAQKVTRSELVEAVYATGYVDAEKVATLSAELSATVLSVSALEGQHVRKGQAIITFDSAQPQLLAREARAAVAEQQALVRECDLKLARSRRLFADGAVSRQQLDEAERAGTQARQALNQRILQLGTREDDLKKLTVRAPFDGTLTLQNVKAGDHVNLNAAVATVTDTSGYQVVVEVDELDVPRLRPGLPAVIALDAMPEARLRATVVRIVPQTDRVTKTSKVYLRFDEAVRSVQAGMTATANIIYSTRKDALLVRKSAVFQEDRKDYVWKIDGGKLRRQQIRTGDSDLTFVEVRGGLKSGDMVAVSPEERYRDGMNARLVRGAKRKS